MPKAESYDILFKLRPPRWFSAIMSLEIVCGMIEFVRYPIYVLSISLIFSNSVSRYYSVNCLESAN